MLVVCVLVASAACSERALDVEVPPVVSPVCGAPRKCQNPATGAALGGHATCPMINGKLEVAHKSSSLGFCHCLHGCGLGIDGTIELSVANFGAVPHTIVLHDVFFTNDEGTLHFEDKDQTSAQRLAREYLCDGEESPFAGVIAAGAIDTLSISEHFDVDTSAPGPYRARAQLDVDGELAWFELGKIVLSAPSACN